MKKTEINLISYDDIVCLLYIKYFLLIFFYKYLFLFTDSISGSNATIKNSVYELL